MQTTLQALFRSTTTGVVVQGFRSSSVPVTHKGYLVESRRPLWFGSSRANHSVFNTLSRHSPLAAVSRSTSIISLRLGSIVPPFPHRFQVLLRLFPLFSLSVLLVLSLEQQWLHEPTYNVEILHRAQMGQDVHIYGIHTYHIYI